MISSCRLNIIDVIISVIRDVNDYVKMKIIYVKLTTNR